MNNEAEIKQDCNDIASNTICIECNVAKKDVFPLEDINIKEEPIEYENAEQKIPLGEIILVDNIDTKPEILEIEESKITCSLDTQNFAVDINSFVHQQFKFENDQVDCVPLKTEVYDKESLGNEKIYYCSKCAFKFDSEINYTLHLKSKHIIDTGKKLFKCNICGRESKYKSSIERHMKTKHTVDNKYKCQQCTFETVCMKAIEQHVATIHRDVNKSKPVKMYTRTLEKMFKCNLCKYESERQSNMLRHIKSKHKEYKCPQCIYETDSKSELKEHLTTHIENTDGKMFIRTAQTYKCKWCKYETRHRSGIYRHIMNKHDKMRVKKYKCSQCEYRTHEISLMKRHLLNHGVKPYECEICNKSFRRRHYLQSHRWTHSNEKRFQCPYCDYKNNHKFSVTIHMRNKHLKRKNKDFKCTQCPYETNFKPHLNRHVKRHLLEGEKEFKCTQCSYNTNFKSNLKLHLRNKHEEVREYKCKQCKYETNCKDKMKQHMLNHDNVKLHECNICNKLFKWRDSLKKHSFIHSEERKFQCAHCDYKSNKKFNLILHLNSKHVATENKEGQETSQTTPVENKCIMSAVCSGK